MWRSGLLSLPFKIYELLGERKGVASWLLLVLIATNFDDSIFLKPLGLVVDPGLVTIIFVKFKLRFDNFYAVECN